MKILDLFSGLGGGSAAFIAEGCEVVTLDLESRFNCDITADILTVTVEQLEQYGPFDFIWASPPCEAFSVAAIGHHWGGGKGAYQPKTEHAKISQHIVSHTINLMAALAPTYGWMMENPRGVLRKLPAVSGLPRETVTYCQYGDSRMKPTDLWGKFPEGWKPRSMCKNGAPCHEAAPRGARTGTQGIKGAAERAIVPIELGRDIYAALKEMHQKRIVL